jgi:hypothetical protein
MVGRLKSSEGEVDDCLAVTNGVDGIWPEEELEDLGSEDVDEAEVGSWFFCALIRFERVI